MLVAFDNTYLSLALNPDTKPSIDPQTGKIVTHAKERIEALIDRHSNNNDTILIPTPCLAEMLCHTPDIEKVIVEIGKSAAFQIAAFDSRCAIDLADESRRARDEGDKKAGIKAGWNEVKFDRQIAITAKTAGASILYTDDKNQAEYARQIGLKVIHTWELDLPPAYAQISLLNDL